MTTTIQKVSGVIFVTKQGQNPKSYFGATGSYQFTDNDATAHIKVGGDDYRVAWADLRVGAQTPTSVDEAKVLLNAIFGS